MFEDDRRENEAECTAKTKAREIILLAVGEAGKAIFWSILGSKVGTVIDLGSEQSWGFECAPAVPHVEGLKK